jgi:homoaconitate hydratase
MGATVVERIARQHMVTGPQRPLRPGDMVSLRPRHLLTHDNTSAVLSKFRGLGADRIHDPRQPVVALDHDIQNASPENLDKYARIEAFCREQSLDFHPAGTGIGHQLVVERGYALPGTVVVASDSHANMYGALGALGTPVVRTDAAAIWATGAFWWQIPRTVQVVLAGALRPGVSGKDVILTLCTLYPDEVLNAAVEFAGPGVASLDMAARLTIANMTTEWGALTGWFPVDEVTLDYLRERRARLRHAGLPHVGEAELATWRDAPPAPDRGAVYAARITVDLARVVPWLAGPDSVQAGAPAGSVSGGRIPIQKAYLLSCVNGRLEDLEVAAGVLRGRSVADGVELYIAAASRDVELEAMRSGAWGALLDAGARPLPPGCGPCIGLGAGLLAEGETAISATNRNFRGRMGHRDARVYLASPATVAASALAGHLDGGAPLGAGPDRDYRAMAVPEPPAERVEIVPGFPARLRGRLVFVPRENLNTDGIYGKEHTYRELAPEEMARAVMANYDPAFALLAGPGDVLVGTRNFGTGSSREQAVTALQARGIHVVIAESVSQTYQRNAFNNGLICLECAGLVRQVEAALAAEVAAGLPTIVPGDEVEVDFEDGVVTWRGGTHRFPPLGRVPQELVAAGGIEPLVRARLAAAIGVNAGAT